MKELFAESVTGLERLIIQQVARVEEEIQHGRKCRVSVRSLECHLPVTVTVLT